MTITLAIDQSTAGTKALLFDERGSVLAKASRPHQQYYPQPGWVEHDADEIYLNTLAVCRALLAQQPVAQVDAISITNQRETFVIFERETGKPLHHAIVWQCRRGEPICADLIAAGHSEQVRRITGLTIDTYFPASKIKWLLDERPDLREQVERGAALIGTIDAYLIYRLTGGAVFASDHTNACRTLLYDIGQRQWSADLCALFGVPIKALPDVRESSAHFGETTLDSLLPGPVAICGVMGDSQAALFAQRCYAPGSAKATFGTGSSVLLNVGDQMPLSDSGIVTTLGWVHAGQPTYALEGIINFTGGTIAWMQNQMRYIDDPAETEALATSVPDTGGVYVVPAFVGLSAPYWQPTARGAIVGLTPQTTKAHIIRAALEGIAYRIRDVLDLMQADADIKLATLHADGGMVSNRFLMQYVADLCRVTVRAAQVPELSAQGAMLCGLLGIGAQVSLAALAQLPVSFTDYAPLMSAADAEARYRGWQVAVQRVL